MLRRTIAISAVFCVSLEPVQASQVLRQLGTLSSTSLSREIFDGGRTSAVVASPVPGRGGSSEAGSPRAVRVAAWDYQTLREAKAVLGDGTVGGSGPIMPFTFRFTSGGSQTAQSGGLEGFVYAENEIANTRGRGEIEHHVQDYVNYLDALFAPVSWAQDARQRLAWIDKTYTNPREKYDKIMEFANDYTGKLRQSVKAGDAAGWMRTARIYELFPRAYNLEGKRENRDAWEVSSKKSSKEKAPPFFADFGAQDFADIRDRGFDAVWPMGIFPIGERGRTGTGGGSPYSIKDHAGVNKDLGSPGDFRGFVDRAHQAGLRVIIDFVPNHTSMDSKMLMEHPEYFVHRPADSSSPDSPPDGYFVHQDPKTGKKLWIRHGASGRWGGGRDYWIDTAQVDYSNPMFRRAMIDNVAGWVQNYGVDGFRIDMAHLITNAVFGGTWAGEAGGSMPQREFLEEMTTELKTRFPGVAFMAEAYDRWDDLSKAGVDLIYGKNNQTYSGGQHLGWYDAMAGRNPGWIRGALQRSEFLQWQTGGSDMLDMVGNHDEPAPGRVFGQWERGATFLTLMNPGSLLFYGSAETGFDGAVPNGEQKPLPFSVPTQIDWANADRETARFYNDTFQQASEIKGLLGEPEMTVLRGDTPWVGYLLTPKDPAQASIKAAAVLANPTGQTVQVSFKDARLGVEYNGSLPPYGHALVKL